MSRAIAHLASRAPDCRGNAGAPPAAAGRPGSRRPPAKKRAFTTLEVLVALMILGFMSATLISGYLNILNAYDRMKTRPSVNLDVRFARNALLAESDFETAQAGDQFEGASGRQITWSSVIEPTNTANLFLVTFTCELGSGPNPGENEETVTEIFRILRPTWAATSGFSPDAATLRAEARDRILLSQQPSPLSGLGPGSVGGGSAGGSGGAGKSSGSGSGGSGSGKSSSGGGRGGAPTR